MNSEQETVSESKVKKPYVKPTYEFISLNPDEMKMFQNACVMGGEIPSEQEAAIKECIDRKRQS